jgi:predicted HAD superfamily Cof-like phosphohydrolase
VSSTARKSPHQRRIESFMRQAGQSLPDKPTIPPAEVRLLRARLIMEECLETIEALGVRVTFADVLNNQIRLQFRLLDFEDSGNPPDIEGIADGCADISVVTIGTLTACGISDEPILEEVDAANLRKFGPGGYRDEHGKWRKPPDWTPPNIIGELEKQGMPAGVVSRPALA